jgi:hypothetical protein
MYRRGNRFGIYICFPINERVYKSKNLLSIATTVFSGPTAVTDYEKFQYNLVEQMTFNHTGL